MNIDLTVPGSASRTEADLLHALGRLARRRPNDERLQQDCAAGLPVITHANVALEARKSRTSIGYENCRYPELRRRVTEAMKAEAEELANPVAKAGTRSSREIIRDLQAEINRLKSERAAFATRMNDALHVARRLQERLDRAQRAIDREAARSRKARA